MTVTGGVRRHEIAAIWVAFFRSQAMLLLAGRDILALADGRFLVVWVVAGDRSEPSAGIHYNISVSQGGVVFRVLNGQ